MAIVNVFYFIIFILSIAACCQIVQGLCECMCRWTDYWYALKSRRLARQTQIVPMVQIMPPNPTLKKYIVFVNPHGHPISLGLPKEYSNV